MHKDMSRSERRDVHKFFYNFMIANHMTMRQNKNMLNSSAQPFQQAFINVCQLKGCNQDEYI